MEGREGENEDMSNNISLQLMGRHRREQNTQRKRERERKNGEEAMDSIIYYTVVVVCAYPRNEKLANISSS